MKKLMLLTGILAFLLFSCNGDLPLDEFETRKFWAQSFKDGKFYQLDAELLAEGKYCNVWVEKDSGVNKETAKKVSDEFDKNIYPKMTAAFSNDFDFGEEGTFSTMEVADAWTDGDGKLCILLLDIRDSYQQGVNESAVGGYFLPDDLFEGPNSNCSDMIYIDTNPGKPGESASNMTLAHEMQHLMNEITTQLIRFDGDYYYPMDLWIDEGLSGAAEYVYSGTHPVSRWGWYSANGNGTDIKSSIDKGNNFFVWGNRTNENQYAEQDDYATAYLFFQWLRIQKGGVGIYKDIISSENWDYKAVTSAAASIDSTYNNSWKTLLRDWLAANYINDASGRYGYKNDSTLKGLNKHLLTTNGTTPLYPGEGVFSKIDAAYVTANSKPSDTTTINYSVLTTSPGTALAQGALLTYNVNTVNSAGNSFPPSENGSVTGVASVSVDVSVDGRFVSAPITLSGPYWVSGGDVLRRNGRASSADVPRLSRRIEVNE